MPVLVVEIVDMPLSARGDPIMSFGAVSTVCIARGSLLGIARLCLLFFSSRRRHTRFDCDWSSDVCSSDLAADPRRTEGALLHHALLPHRDVGIEQHVERVGPALPFPALLGVVVPVEVADLEIGRASCREKV